MSAFDNIDLQGYSQSPSMDLFDSPVAHAATVSPSDLFNDDAMFSTDPAIAFPPLEYSPDSGFDTSPAFGDLDSSLDMSAFANMPLFPETDKEYTGEPAIVQNDSFDSLSALSKPKVSQPSPMVRQKSSPGRPPIVHDRKASLSAGIAKANQKPRKELDEITFDDDDDKETLKRKKNTAAARKSRERRQQTMSAMSAEIMRLRAIVSALGGDPDAEGL